MGKECMATSPPTSSPLALSYHLSMSGQGQECKPPTQLSAHTHGTVYTLTHLPHMANSWIICKHSMLKIGHVLGLMDKDSFFQLKFFSFLFILQYSVSLSFLVKETCKSKNKVEHQCKV